MRERERTELGARPIGAGRLSDAPGWNGERLDEAQTLIDVLRYHARASADRIHVRFCEGDTVTAHLSYAALLDRAAGVAAGLQQRGIIPRDPVAIMLPTGPEYFDAFYGVLLAGAVPVPIYPPARLGGIADHLRRHQAILDNCGASVLITVAEAKPFARLLQSHVHTLRHVMTTADLGSGDATLEVPETGASDIALLQYTSGSTGHPKGVVLSHANLLANIRAIGRAIEVNQGEDVAVSWLPLYHDMGLIGACFCSLYYRLPLVLVSPLDFIRRPQSWLEAIHRHRGTLSAAPNFAYEYLLRKLRNTDLEGLDLSSWRVACNGAEAVSADTVRRFIERFGPYGFRAEAMMPVFGLAECSVALTFPPLGRSPGVDRIDRAALADEGRAEPARDDAAGALEIVACGRALHGHEIRVVDDQGRALPDRRVGHVEFRGPSATSGYYRNPEATAELVRQGWLATGDKGYVAGGDLYITGRTKDVIIRAGRNIYPGELEEAVGNLPGVRKGGVVVFGHTDPESKVEKLVVAAESSGRAVDHEQTQRSIHQLAIDLVGVRADHVVIVKPRSLLKTSSGKIRRAANRELYERGELGRRPNGWWELARLGVGTVTPEAKRLGKAVIERLGGRSRAKP